MACAVVTYGYIRSRVGTAVTLSGLKFRIAALVDRLKDDPAVEDLRRMLAALDEQGATASPSELSRLWEAVEAIEKDLLPPRE